MLLIRQLCKRAPSPSTINMNMGKPSRCKYTTGDKKERNSRWDCTDSKTKFAFYAKKFNLFPKKVFQTI